MSIIDFQAAKVALIAADVAAKQPDLNRQVEIFTFSRLPKRERVARILSSISEGDATKAEEFLDFADSLLPYIEKDFAVPFGEV